MKFAAKSISAISVLLFLALGPVYFSSSIAEAGAVPGESLVVVPSQLTGTLATRGSNGIKVNGAHSATGATILSGATIETGTGVGATIHLVNRGVLEFEPNTKLTVDFDQDHIKVMLSEGCLHLRTRSGTTGEVITASGAREKTDPTREGKLETCPPGNARPIRSDGLFFLIRSAAFELIAKGVTGFAVPVAPRGVLY
jgi:hypothetical protein